MEISWSEFKKAVDNRSLSIQFVELGDNYLLRAIDGYFDLTCLIPLDRVANDDTVDFEDNYKVNGNASPKIEVVTQFEKRDKTLKLAHGEATVDSETGLATVLIKIPGVPNSGDGRWISCGIGFFDVHTPGDKILGVYFTDEDNLLGYGAGTVVGSYTDDDAAEENRGWAIPPNGWLKAEAVGGYGFGPSGFYIKIVGKKAGESPSGKFYINMEWGKVET